MLKMVNQWFNNIFGYQNQSQTEPLKRISPLERISHLLDLLPWLAGIWFRKASNKCFISVRRFRSAILWLFRSAGVRL